MLAVAAVPPQTLKPITEKTRVLGPVGFGGGQIGTGLVVRTAFTEPLQPPQFGAEYVVALWT